MITVYTIAPRSYYSAETAAAIAELNESIVAHNTNVARLKALRETLKTQCATRAVPAADILTALETLRSDELAALFKAGELLDGKATVRQAIEIDRKAEKERLGTLRDETQTRIEAAFIAAGMSSFNAKNAVRTAADMQEADCACQGVANDGQRWELDRQTREELNSLLVRKAQELFG